MHGHKMLMRCGRWCHNRSLGMLVLRIALGAFFLAHGISKVTHMEAIVPFFGSLGFAPYWAYIVTGVEIFAGLSFILGVFVGIAAPLIVVEMLVSIWKVTGVVPGDPLIMYVSSWGPNVIYAAAALCIFWSGVGRYSLAAYIMKRRGADGMCKDCARGMDYEAAVEVKVESSEPEKEVVT